MTVSGRSIPAVSDIWVQANGLRLHVLDYGGTGRPIVALHGVTNTGRAWQEFAAAAAPALRVFAPDLRGHGDSQWSAAGAYGTADQAADLEQMLGALNLGPVPLVGLSWGGLIVLSLAARRPDLVDRLVLVDIPPSSPHGPTEIPAQPSEFASHAEVVAWERGRSPRASDAMLDVLACYGTRPAPGGHLLRKPDPLFLRYWSFRSEDHWAELRAVACPVLIVRAAESPVLTPEVAERMATEARHGRLVQIPNSGHLVCVEQPVALANAVLEFLVA